MGNFVDHVKITCKAGNGGNGSMSFHREKFVLNGGPDGGDGGNGGNVCFYADLNMHTLLDFRFKSKYTAENGVDGAAGNCTGKRGEDLIIKVPVGTVIREAESGAVVADMDTAGETRTILHGGRGGWGNTHFKTPTRQTPRFAKSGTPGEEWEVILELKLLADVGLLGFPNVGKSTFISVVSEAKPIIADYHFTTITPVLGVVTMGEGESFVVADIPGLIEGASDGVGLGHEFLRHVERCRMLLHIIDAAGSEGRDPIEDFEKINAELEKFDPELSKLPQIVAANKIDMADEAQIERLREYFTSRGYEFYTMCAPIQEGTAEVINAVAKRLKTLPPIKRYETQEIPVEMFERQKDTGFTVREEDGVYIVEAPWLLKILQCTDMDDYESLQYFQRVLHSSGILAKLESMGIQQGDTVEIYDFEFDYMP